MELAAAPGRQGQLGIGPGAERERAPKPVSGLGAVTELVAGDQHTCALISTADLRCWGDNSEGQLDRSRRPKPAPFKLAGVRGVVDVAAARYFDLGLRTTSEHPSRAAYSPSTSRTFRHTPLSFQRFCQRQQVVERPNSAGRSDQRTSS